MLKRISDKLVGEKIIIDIDDKYFFKEAWKCFHLLPKWRQTPIADGTHHLKLNLNQIIEQYFQSDAL